MDKKFRGLGLQPKKHKKDKLNILELGTFKGGATAAFSFFFSNYKIY